MKDLQARLRRLCADIALLEEDLKTAAQGDGTQPLALCDEQVLSQAKGAVDRLRHLLWPYVEAAAKRAAGVDEVLQRYRMERVTTMLQELTDRVAEPRLAAMPGAQSFFSSIQQIATTAVEKHLERLTRQPLTRPSPSPQPKTFVH